MADSAEAASASAAPSNPAPADQPSSSTPPDAASEGRPPSSASPAPAPSRNPLKRLYRWILSWAHHPMGSWALGVFAFLDSFIFPIPPLYLQVALSLERPRRSFWYAAVNTAASVLGSIIGYGIGYLLFDSVGKWLVGLFGGPEEFDLAGRKLREDAFLAILAYSFLPLPYKLITIASGLFHGFVSLPTLLLASTLGRGCRFFLLGTLCFALGPRAKAFIERYFNGVCLAIAALVVAAIVVFKVLLRKGP